ncbi:MAG: 3-dehydroquinate synthase [Oligoflexales bacterium]|nr:3-dehydroquinate synthase [Oligoflexales bacterium]
MSGQLNVSWEIKIPFLEPDGWYFWSSDILGDERNNGLSSVEESAGLSMGTERVLRRAFELSLNRHMGWDLSKLTSLEDAFIDASRIFKRGVACRKKNGEIISSKKNGSYDVVLYDEDIRGLNRYLDSTSFVIADRKVWDIWGDKISSREVFLFSFDENSKILSSIEGLVSTWKGSGRKANWIIIGGGVISDMAAFAADLCGCSFVLVPTTLLSIVDACVGGKTGVNYPPYGKNQIGSFAFPKKVVVYSEWLSSLDARLIRAGASECYKHAMLIGDRNLMKKITDAIHDRGYRSFGSILKDLINVKVSIIEKDSTESGQRATLNLGHTLAHALEGISQSENTGEKVILHGEAVNIGLAFSSILSWKLSYFTEMDVSYIIGLLKSAGSLMTKKELIEHLGLEDLLSEDFWRRMMKFFFMDKKATDCLGNDTRWVILKSFGIPFCSEKGQYTISVKEDLLKESWSYLCSILG